MHRFRKSHQDPKPDSRNPKPKPPTYPQGPRLSDPGGENSRTPGGDILEADSLTTPDGREAHGMRSMVRMKTRRETRRMQRWCAAPLVKRYQNARTHQLRRAARQLINWGIQLITWADQMDEEAQEKLNELFGPNWRN